MEHIYKELQKPIQNTLEIYKQLYKTTINKVQTKTMEHIYKELQKPIQNTLEIYKQLYKTTHTTMQIYTNYKKRSNKNNGTYIQRTIDNYTKHYRNIQKPIQT